MASSAPVASPAQGTARAIAPTPKLTGRPTSAKKPREPSATSPPTQPFFVPVNPRYSRSASSRLTPGLGRRRRRPQPRLPLHLLLETLVNAAGLFLGTLD